eukprot:3066427-Rhodomonas_salina.1
MGSEGWYGEHCDLVHAAQHIVTHGQHALLAHKEDHAAEHDDADAARWTGAGNGGIRTTVEQELIGKQMQTLIVKEGSGL